MTPGPDFYLYLTYKVREKTYTTVGSTLQETKVLGNVYRDSKKVISRCLP